MFDIALNALDILRLYIINDILRIKTNEWSQFYNNQYFTQTEISILGYVKD